MLVSENLNTFRKYKDITKALDIGMIVRWPKIVEWLEKKLHKTGWNVNAAIDENDQYIININKMGINAGVISKIDIIINADEKALFIEKNTTHTHGDPRPETSNKTAPLVDINIEDDNEDIAIQIANQIINLGSSFDF